MASRTYDIKLDCGCYLSADGGGGLMPCYYNKASDEEVQKHTDAWQKFKGSGEEEKHNALCHLNNCGAEGCESCEKAKDVVFAQVKKEREELFKAFLEEYLENVKTELSSSYRAQQLEAGGMAKMVVYEFETRFLKEPFMKALSAMK